MDNGAETPDIDDEEKLALFQKMHEEQQKMQEEQQKISKRVSRRRKSKKKVKKKRPVTAKYTYGMMRDRYPRPWTSNASKPKKKRKKAKKMAPQDVYLQQLRQHQILQQLAMEQEQANQQEMVNQEAEEDIQISPEQAVLLYHQLAERQKAGEELTEEELQQLEFLHNLLELNRANQAQIDQASNVAIASTGRKQKGKKSKKKTKRKGRKQQQMIDPRSLMMMQNQLAMNQDNEPMNPNIELPEGVDEIKEVEEKDTPIRELNQPLEEHKETEQYSEYEGQENEVHDTNIPNQINAQVPAQFTKSEEEAKMGQMPFYPNDPNQQMIQNLTPEQIYQLQNMQNQQYQRDLESTEREAKYAEDQSQNMEMLKHFIDEGAKNGIVKKDLLSILPLSQSVAKAKKKFKPMKKYDLDVYDKKLQSELKKAQSAANSEHYFQEILKQSLENALVGKGAQGNF